MMAVIAGTRVCHSCGTELNERSRAFVCIDVRWETPKVGSSGRCEIWSSLALDVGSLLRLDFPSLVKVASDKAFVERGVVLAILHVNHACTVGMVPLERNGKP